MHRGSVPNTTKTAGSWTGNGVTVATLHLKPGVLWLDGYAKRQSSSSTSTTTASVFLLPADTESVNGTNSVYEVSRTPSALSGNSPLQFSSYAVAIDHEDDYELRLYGGSGSNYSYTYHFEWVGVQAGTMLDTPVTLT